MKFLFVLAAALLLTVAVPASASHDSGTDARQFVRELGAGNCSGVVLQPGLVLTADHCLNTPTLVLRLGGAEPLVIARGDGRLDYALLQYPEAEAPCPCATVAAREAEQDEPIFIVGYPRGFRIQVVTLGTSQGVQDNPTLPYGRRLVTTALVAGGNSGGGVFAFRGHSYVLVGLLVESMGHLSFAMPLADLRPFLAPYTPMENP